MTFGLMKVSVVRNDLRLQRSALMLATVGNLKPSMLQSLSLLYSLLLFLLPHHNVRMVPWSRMMNHPALHGPLMLIPSALLLRPTPFLSTPVVPVSTLGQMRELVLVVSAEAKD
jgi:hypothetical protein